MKIKTKDMILVAFFTALTAAGGFIKIPVGPVPITLQYLFTALSGVLLGPFLGSLSQLLYVILGLLGIPIFAGGGGLSYIFDPSFGYLIGFIVAPYVIGKILAQAKAPCFFKIFLASIVGVVIIYIIGVPYMFIILNNVLNISITLEKAIKIGFLVFIPGDLIKSIAVALLGIRIIPAIKRLNS
ncbi:biotin transporter BioY [Haloimpatiens sp. FM7315]|uniref:biotin transporter BioY n=1 Tax=Haloimpatiens sp. FM7315 TaxID=3298609 RepID=UPI0035A326EC